MLEQAKKLLRVSLTQLPLNVCLSNHVILLFLKCLKLPLNLLQFVISQYYKREILDVVSILTKIARTTIYDILQRFKKNPTTVENRPKDPEMQS